jgi:thymidylate kinase
MAILEEPKENFIELDASNSTQDIIEEIIDKLSLIDKNL